MKWLVFVAVAAGILIIFGATYGISRVLEKRRAPKYKTTAPDDDPQFLRDLAKKLKDEDKDQDPDPSDKREQ